MTITIDVTNEADLNAAIGAIDGASSGADYLIQFTSDISEGGTLTAISSVAGVTATIDGGGHTLDGISTYQGLFVYSGALTVQNLTLANMRAVGGGSTGGGGGGGPGLAAACSSPARTPRSTQGVRSR